MSKNSKAYCLEHKSEADRLEFQSTFPKYDFKSEFKNFCPKEDQRILDAGSGSGIVLRHFAQAHPDASFIGSDMSEERVAEARERANQITNLTFEVQDLRELSFSENHFDHILSRYVVEHVPKADIAQVFAEIFRVTKPGGEFHCVDFDGPIFNLYPCPTVVSRVLDALSLSPQLDLWIGRKIPFLMNQAGFSNISWRIETVECQGEYLEHEFQLLPEKFDRIENFISDLMGDMSIAKEFKREYLDALRKPGAVLYYNKFIVSGVKPSFLKILDSK